MSQGTLAPAQQHEEKLRTLLASPEVERGLADALGSWMNPQTFLAQMLIACSDAKVDKCTVASKFKAVHFCATLGLLPTYQQVALIPRKNKDTEQYEISVMPQWQGLKALMERHPDVLEVQPVLVLTTDEIQWAGDGPDMVPIHHRFDPLIHVARSIEDLRGGYLRITYRDGRPPKFHIVTADYINRCMLCSESYKGREKAIKSKKDWIPACPWTDGWFEQQALKTVLRSAYARRAVPIDPMVAGRVETFLKQEDSLLGNDPRIIDHDAQPAVPAIAHSSRSAMLASQLSQPRQTVPVSGTVEGAAGSQPVADSREESTHAGPTDEASTEPAAGELVDGQDGLAEGSRPGTTGTTNQSTIGQFLDMLATVRNRKEVERLRDHFTGPDSQVETTPEERQEINAACNSKAAEFPAPSVPAKPKGRQEQKPLVQ